jgi:hypothetical protein
MSRRLCLAMLSLIVLSLGSCGFSPTAAPSPPATGAPTDRPSPTITPAPPTRPTAQPSPTPLPGPCEAVAEAKVVVYQRPSSQADVFGSLPFGSRVVVEGRTADGWLGFDPGVAQAANVGIFRLRWVNGSSGVRVEGDCRGVPELPGLPARVCFTMPMDEVLVYAEPSTSAEIVAVLTLGDYAAVTAMTSDEWAAVDLSVGNTALDVQGWILKTTLNLNGPCTYLPFVEP